MDGKWSRRLGYSLGALGVLAAFVNGGGLVDAVFGGLINLGIGWLIGIPLDRRAAKRDGTTSR